MSNIKFPSETPDITPASDDKILISDTSNGGAASDAPLSELPISTATQTALDNKVDKVAGKGLSTEDYTTAEKSKLAGIEAGAEVNNISDVNATDLTDGGNTTLHIHDNRYYTEGEVDTLLSGKQNSLGYNPLQSVVAGTNVTIDATDPLNPIISSSGGGGSVDSVNGKTGVVVLETADIAESTDKNYVTNADLVNLGNLSGTNTGDQDLSSYAYKLTNTTTKTANYTANPFELISCDVSAGSFTVTLPSAPADGTVISIKLNGIGSQKYLTLATSGTDKFNTSTGTVAIYMYLFGEFANVQYNATTGLWNTFISAGTYNFATQFPGVDATTPITDADISIDTTTRILTITPPLGYFNVFVDGGGIITRYRKTGTISFPAFTDTSGEWYFYFNSSGVATTTQTPWTEENLSSLCPIYRILWNSTLVGSAKLVAQYIEYHMNDIPAIDHIWKHKQGCIWEKGFNITSNFLSSGTPNSDGRNTVIALSSGTNVDDNLPYTVTNSTAGTRWTQDLGNTTAASLTSSNSAQFKIYTQDLSGNVSFLSATRYPFPWNGTTNVPDYITTTGTRVPVTNQRFMVVFVYATQNPVAGEPLKVISATQDFTSITLARAYTYTDIQNSYPRFANDTEIRPLYRLIYEVHTGTPNAYDVLCKYSVLREYLDIRKAAITTTTAVSGSLPATSVTFTPAGNIASTNVQSAIEELDAEKLAATGFNENLSDTHTSGATGDIWYRDSAGKVVRLGIGSTDNILKVSGGLPAWATPASGAPTEIRIRIPGELVADANNYQGVFWRNTTGNTITISNVKIKVATAAAGTGASAAFNIYKSSGTDSNGINTSAVNLFTSAIDLTTNYTSDSNTPNTTTVENGRWVSLRCTASAGATNKASDCEVVISYS